MENYSYFYQAVTKIAEDRIKELVRHAREAEARNHVFPEAGAYYRGCAQTVYLAWRDIVDGWHACEDVARLESMIGPTLRAELCGNE